MITYDELMHEQEYFIEHYLISKMCYDVDSIEDIIDEEENDWFVPIDESCKSTLKREPISNNELKIRQWEKEWNAEQKDIDTYSWRWRK